MIPNTIHANQGNGDGDEDRDNDSLLSDDEEMIDLTALESAARHFHHGDSRGSTRNNRDGVRVRQRRSSSYMSGEKASNDFHRQPMDSRTSMLSKDSSSGSDHTILRRNGELKVAADEARHSFSNRSINSLRDKSSSSSPIEDEVEGGNQSPRLAFNSMSQIEEDYTEENIPSYRTQGSYSSNANSTAARTAPSMVASSISSFHDCNNSYHQGARYNSSTSTFNLTDEEREELEIEQFNNSFPREVQRLSVQRLSAMGAMTGRPSFSGVQQLRLSNASVDAGFPPSCMRMSTTSRKRRSCAENDIVEDAAAKVAAMFADESNSDTEEDCTVAIEEFSYSSRTNSNSRRNSTRSNVSGMSSLTLNYAEHERPRKRLSSSSAAGRRSFQMASTEDQYGNMDMNMNGGSLQRESMTAHLEPIPGSNTSAMSAACAAVAAEEAERAYAARLSLHACPESMNPNVQSQGKRRFQRRSGFVVSSLQREAMVSQADRMKRLNKDRIESRLGRTGQRRSMSYSAGIKLKSNIIATSLPEDGDTILGAETALQFQENPDFQNLARNRMERRVNSMPDPNAISRLSQTSFNDDVDFSARGSALSATLDASFSPAKAVAEPRYSLPAVSMQNHGHAPQRSFSFCGNQMHMASFHNPLSSLQSMAGLHHTPQHQQSSFKADSSSVSSIGSPGTFYSSTTSFSSLNQFPQQRNIAQVQDFELQSAAALHANTIIAETVAATHQAAALAEQADLFMALQQPHPNSFPILPHPTLRSPCVSVFDNDRFDREKTTSTHQAAALAHHADLFMALQQQQPHSNSFPQRPHPTLRSSSVSVFDDDKFDGKTTTVFAIPIQRPIDYDTTRLLHEACRIDDIDVIEKVLQNFPMSTRWSLSDSDTGDIALHVGE